MSRAWNKRPVPKAYLDVPFVEPSAKAQRVAREQEAAAARAKKEANAAKEKALDGACNVDRACAACGGAHYWGNGPGCDPKTLGPAFKSEKRPRLWLCGASKCRKVLPELSPAQQKEAHKWLELVNNLGMSEARELSAWTAAQKADSW